MATPQFGTGKPSEATIDQVNIWMRSQPWWQQLKGSSAKLSESQRQAIMRAAQAQGVVVDEGDMEVDPAGNFNPKGHKLRNTLIVAGIAGATIATMGAAGVFSGAAGAGAGAAGAGGAASAAAGTGGALASTTIGTGAIGGIAGGTGLAAGTAAAHGGIIAGLTSAGGLSLGRTLADTFTNVYGARQSANANRESLAAQTSSADRAAALAKQATDEALAYQKEQDALAQDRSEVDRRANFDQYMARATGAQHLGDTLGFHVDLPSYVPGRRSSGGDAPGSAGAASGPAPKVSDTGDIGGQVSAYFKSRGVADTETPYWIEKWPELVARGKEIHNPNYANERLAAAEIFGGGGGGNAAPEKRTIGSVLAPRAMASAFVDPSTVTLAPPPSSRVFRPNTIGAYLRRG